MDSSSSQSRPLDSDFNDLSEGPPECMPFPPAVPKTPFELFSEDAIEERNVVGVKPEGSPSLSSTQGLEERWANLSDQERARWEAQYGREMLKYMEKHGKLENEQSVSNQPPRNITMGEDQPTGWDHAPPAESFWLHGRSLEYRQKPPRHFSKHGGRNVYDADSDEDRDGPHLKNRQPAPEVLHRAELYTLKYHWGSGRQLTLGADHVQTVEHNAPMEVETKDVSRREASIFEVTTFLATPNPKGGSKGRPTNMMYYPEKEYRAPDTMPYRPGVSIQTRAEAGTILTINSSTIIKAIRTIAPVYPGVTFEINSFTLAEPFCILLHFREQMLEYRDRLELEGQKKIAQDADPGPDDANAAEKRRPLQAYHITKLYDYVDNKYLEAMTAEKLRWQQEQPACTFEWAWLLFAPGTLVYEPAETPGDLPRAYLVESFFLKGLFRHSRKSNKPRVRPSRLEAAHKGDLKHLLKRIKVNLLYLKHDGRKWVPAKKKVKISPFEGEICIASLPIYPAKYANDPTGATRQKVLETGRRYHALATRGLYEYHGNVLSGSRRWLDSRIIVDSETYHYDPAATWNPSREYDNSGVEDEYDSYDEGSERDIDGRYNRSKEVHTIQILTRSRRGRRRPQPPPRDRYRNIDDDSDSDVSCDWSPEIAGPDSHRDMIAALISPHRREKHLSRLPSGSSATAEKNLETVHLICDRDIMAYALQERSWVLLEVTGVTECTFDESMISDLQVEENAKHLLQAVSQSYALHPPRTKTNEETGYLEISAAQPWSSDFIPDKGRGQFILLHGRPGVGKTTAAECVAEMTRRPLLAITCGELGDLNSDVERMLTKWLRLGLLWNAVVLLDEADIFLEARERGDTQRNTLVTIFLRALEYYPGLMFLTTNRVGAFDEAIISRIPVILHFPDLTDKDRVRIWDTSFRRLTDERSDIKFSFSIYDACLDDTLRPLNWNGREIRHAFNTMIALAEWDARRGGKHAEQPDHTIEVKREHLHRVAAMSSEFKEYMADLRGVDEADYARDAGLRNDTYARTLPV